MNELNEYRAKKEGRVTPRELIKHLTDAVERGEIETVVYVTMSPDGSMNVGWSDVRTTVAIGMFSIGTQELIDSMRG